MRGRLQITHPFPIFCLSMLPINCISLNQGAEYQTRNDSCTKILSFDFNDDFNSDGCNGNLASGVPRGDPIIGGGTLCLDGDEDYLSVSN